MKVINLFAGPGAGKSSCSAALFAEMKFKKYNVELVTEVAKEIVWEKNFKLLEDQLYITASQNRKLFRLKGQVDWVITDSPLLLALMYVKKDYLPNIFSNLIWELHESYSNYNFFIERKKLYVEIGRTQSESEAKKIDSKLHKLLDSNYIVYKNIEGNKDAAKTILEYIERQEGEKRE